jgi:hypothetical protein
MMSAETALLIGMFSGVMFGYSVGFLFARALYRKPARS